MAIAGMVQPRWKSWLYFALFVLPALVLYGLFFLYPFAQGIRISFTNWDGLTPDNDWVGNEAGFTAKAKGRYQLLNEAPAGAAFGMSSAGSVGRAWANVTEVKEPAL